ncbi:hypothetical protein KIN20_014296 [Parelaphostrongylus tenuis]|uniref:Uncharacterized protein n=1 Tax=Parelaphostrongylus tenuis TaxID=148309 RepID=A0AAD5MYS6_PARTN|nr:hypothetical protein KIN20_014296 [Parelaphostrongylus tenuis]
MLSLDNVTKAPPHRLQVFLLTTGAVLGCGTLPVKTAYVDFLLPTQFHPRRMFASEQISPNSRSAEAFVNRLIIQDQQERAAGLPDFVRTTILGQLGIKVFYTPLSYPAVSVDPVMMVMQHANMMTARAIFGNTVTATCLSMVVVAVAAGAGAGNMLRILALDPFGYALRHGSCYRHLNCEFNRRRFKTTYPLV